jgi:hypothetical protein
MDIIDDDVINGTSGNDFFDLSQGGNDTVSGGGKDIFFMGAALPRRATIPSAWSSRTRRRSISAAWF